MTSGIGQDHVNAENFPILLQGELHVWQVSANIGSDPFAEYKTILTEAELAKVPFFKFRQVRDSYILSQSAIRILLSGYLSIPPGLVKLGRRRKGKPYSIDDPGLYFNMSNSGEFVVIAFSRDSEIGIDIEQIRPLHDLDEMINRNFTRSEIKYINSRPEERINRFFRFWTIKESFLKAIGEGMRLRPDNLEFAIEKNCIRQLSIEGVFDQDDWNFKEISKLPDYIGTITYRRADTIIRQMEFK